MTGDDRIDLADAQASRYRPGHVLTAHNDVSPGKNRLYGYVLNFSRDWRADWGGNLVFYGDDGHIQHGWVPATSTWEEDANAPYRVTSQIPFSFTP